MVTEAEEVARATADDLAAPDDKGVRHPRCASFTRRRRRCRHAALDGHDRCGMHLGGVVSNTVRKGKKGEGAAVKVLLALGVKARRQRGSGAIEGLPADVAYFLQNGTGSPNEHSAEVKQRAVSRWRLLDNWRAGADLLVLLLDQQAPGQPAPEPMLFMPASTLRDFMADAHERGFHEMSLDEY